MTESRIQKITKDIANYREAIENAEGALAEAERELSDELDRHAVAEFDSMEDYPEYNKD